MADAGGVAGRRILVVEDDYLIVSALVEALEDLGAEIIGPAQNIEKAMELVRTTPSIDGALLDVNLRGKMAFPVADALQNRRVPFVFTTGYDRLAIPERYAEVTRCEKPVNASALAGALFS